MTHHLFLTARNPFLWNIPSKAGNFLRHWNRPESSLIQTRLTPQVQQAPLPRALSIFSTEDHNGALSDRFMSPVIQTIQKNFTSTLNRVSELQELPSQIKAPSRESAPLQLLSLFSHSDGSTLHFKTPYHLQDIQPSHFPLLDSKGQVIVSACRSALIAQKIAKTLKRETFGTLFPYSAITQFLLTQKNQKTYPLSFVFGMQNFVRFQEDGTAQPYPISFEKLLSQIPSEEVLQRFDTSDPYLILKLPKELTTQEQRIQAFEQLCSPPPSAGAGHDPTLRFSLYLLCCAMHQTLATCSTLPSHVPKAFEPLREDAPLLFALQNPKMVGSICAHPKAFFRQLEGTAGDSKKRVLALHHFFDAIYESRDLCHPLIQETLYYYYFTRFLRGANKEDLFNDLVDKPMNLLPSALIASYFWIQQGEFDRALPLLRPLIHAKDQKKYEEILCKIEDPQLSSKEKNSLYLSAASLQPNLQKLIYDVLAHDRGYESSPFFSARFVLDTFRSKLQT